MDDPVVTLPSEPSRAAALVRSEDLIRGPLRYEVTTSSPQLEAGRSFSVFVKINNPYNVSARIRSVTTKLPVEFADIESIQRHVERRRLLEEAGRIGKSIVNSTFSNSDGDAARKQQLFKDLTKDLIRMLPFGSLLSAGYTAAQVVTASAASNKKTLFEKFERALDITDFSRALDNAESAEKEQELYRAALHKIKQQVEEIENTRISALLQPGNSTVHAFTLQTRSRLFFPPSSYDLHIQIEYEIDGRENQDSINYTLNMRAPITSLIIGSAAGAMCGHLMRDIFERQTLAYLIATPTVIGWLSWSMTLLGSVLLGVVLVVAFARKKEAQPILAVEDFWGGLFVGVIAGYSGKSLLDQLVAIEPSPNAAAGGQPPAPQ